MPKLSATVLKARINRLQRQLAATEAHKAPAIKKIQALMKKLGVTIADLTGETATERRRRPAKRSESDASTMDVAPPKSQKPRGRVAIKYRDDKGNTWTGRGKTPRWLVEAEKAGAKRDNFLVK